MIHATTGRSIHAGARETGYVLDALDEGSDPLGIGSSPDPGAIASRAVTRALRGATDGQRATLVAILRKKHDTVRCMGETTARLMASIGVDPLVLAWLATESQDIAYASDDGGTPVAAVDLTGDHLSSDNMTKVVLAEDVEWYASGTVVMKGLPQSILDAVSPGDTLLRLLSHPILDPRGYVIDEIDADERTALFNMTTGGDDEPVTLEQLAAISEAMIR